MTCPMSPRPCAALLPLHPSCVVGCVWGSMFGSLPVLMSPCGWESWGGARWLLAAWLPSWRLGCSTHTEFTCGCEQAAHSFPTISTAELSATSKKGKTREGAGNHPHRILEGRFPSATGEEGGKRRDWPLESNLPKAPAQLVGDLFLGSAIHGSCGTSTCSQLL